MAPKNNNKENDPKHSSQKTQLDSKVGKKKTQAAIDRQNRYKFNKRHSAATLLGATEALIKANQCTLMKQAGASVAAAAATAPSTSSQNSSATNSSQTSTSPTSTSTAVNNTTASSSTTSAVAQSDIEVLDRALPGDKTRSFADVWDDIFPDENPGGAVRYIISQLCQKCLQAYNRRTREMVRQNNKYKRAKKDKLGDLCLGMVDWRATLRENNWYVPDIGFLHDKSLTAEFDESAPGLMWRKVINGKSDDPRSYSEIVLKKKAFNFTYDDLEFMRQIKYPYEYLSDALCIQGVWWFLVHYKPFVVVNGKIYYDHPETLLINSRYNILTEEATIILNQIADEEGEEENEEYERWSDVADKVHAIIFVYIMAPYYVKAGDLTPSARMSKHINFAKDWSQFKFNS
jgi:hypothetical protein